MCEIEAKFLINKHAQGANDSRTDEVESLEAF